MYFCQLFCMTVMSGFLHQGENMFQTNCWGKYLDIRGLKEIASFYAVI